MMMQRLLDLSRTIVTQKVPVGVVTTIAMGLACLSASRVAAAEKPREGPIGVFLGKPSMDVQPLFKAIRHLNIVVTLKGTVLSILGDKKLLARRSEDGGKTWAGWRIVDILPDGPQNTNYGCFAGLVRLPIAGRDILLYSNCDSPASRQTWHGLGELRRRKDLAFEVTGVGRPLSVFLPFRGTPRYGVRRLDLPAL